MTINGIKSITVPVSDQDKAKEFYVDLVGFETIRDLNQGPMRWLEVAPGGSATSFILMPGMPGLTPGGLKGVQLFTDNLDGDCARLSDAGVEVDGPTDRPWGRDAKFSDPDGNGYVLTAVSPGN